MGDPTLRYRLGFSSGSLLAREGRLAAEVYLRLNDWSSTRQCLIDDNIFQARTEASKSRRVREVIQRLSELTPSELNVLADSTASERAHLMWAAACRRYTLIGEFAEEVVRERFLTFSETLDHATFDGFLTSKSMWHEELANLRDSTKRKLRANIFRMLIEAGLLTEDGVITPAILSDRVAELLSDRLPSDVRFFPVRTAIRGVAS